MRHHLDHFRRYFRKPDSVRALRALAVLPQRFWRKVLRSERCWIWTGQRKGGYGTFRVGKRKLPAHRVSYIMQHGPIRKGHVLLHTCDVPACVNPAHLRAGTLLENTRDMMAKGRHRTCPRRGEAHPRARITADVARAILRDVLAGVNDYQVAKHHGVSRSLVQHIKHGRRWRQACQEEREAHERHSVQPGTGCGAQGLPAPAQHECGAGPHSV